MSGKTLKIDLRRERILEALARDGRVYVSQLASALGATTVTIRNDLNALERDGRLTRIQGGATAAASTVGLGDRQAEKQAIGRAFAALVRDGDRLFLNAGTTTLAAAAALRGFRELHIVTDSLRVAQLLGEQFPVQLLGGTFNARHDFAYGEDALAQLDRYQADWAVISVDSISAAEGVTLCHPEETAVTRRMLERAARGAILADHVKVGSVGYARICAAAAPLLLVTDEAADPAELQRLRALGVEVRLAGA